MGGRESPPEREGWHLGKTRERRRGRRRKEAKVEVGEGLQWQPGAPGTGNGGGELCGGRANDRSEDSAKPPLGASLHSPGSNTQQLECQRLLLSPDLTHCWEDSQRS